MMFMKKGLLCVALLLFSCTRLYATGEVEYTKFFITILNSNYVPTITPVTPNSGVTISFNDSTLDAIAGKYSFRQFRQAFPNSTNDSLEKVYIIEVSSLEYMFELGNYDSLIFDDPTIANFIGYYLTIDDPAYVPTFSVSNYVPSLSFNQSAINTIAAEFCFDGFELAFPDDSLQPNTYFISVNSGDFIVQLTAGYPVIFINSFQLVPAAFRISITDRTYVPSISKLPARLIPRATSSIPALQAIVNKYNLYDVHQSYPFSNHEALRNIYFIKCNDIQLMDDLKNYDSTIYARGIEAPAISPLYTPNDYGKVNSGVSKHLDLIKAKQAWDIEKGNPNMKLIGISDWYTNTNHDDLKIADKISKVFRNDPSDLYQLPNSTGPDPTYYAHGTVISGTASGTTDNNIGLANAGFNCKLALYSHKDAGYTAAENCLKMSRDGYRIANLSWSYTIPIRAGNANSSTDLTFFTIDKGLEEMFNEMYENGTSVVSGAGNGGTVVVGGFSYDNSAIKFPAAFNHNISVTSVGCKVPLASAVLGSYSVEDEHEILHGITPLHSSSTHHHNKFVDICAPGYGIDGYDYNPFDPTKKYKTNYEGTSLAAPLVAGAIGLMLSKNPDLSPYQVEYLLKQSSYKNIYSIPANQKYDNPKVLGVGRLDMEAAVIAANDFDVNNPVPGTQTMYIEEIKVNHRCFSTTVGPTTLTPVIKNGNGNYEYRWQPLDGCNVSLNDYFAANPNVPLQSNGTLLYYSLVVKELGKEIPRVASKIIKVRLNCTPDVAVRDHYDDWYYQPNDMNIVDFRNWNYWNSPDIWNSTTSTGMVHQNPEYSTSSPNYLRIRVKQNGAGYFNGGQAILKLYWTINSTGEKWPGDWTTNTMTGPNGTVPTGGEITSSSSPVYINTMYAGSEDIYTIEWWPPNPADYVSGDKQVGICILARILDNNTPPHGLTEQTYPTPNALNYNVRQNNNIATKNFVVTDFQANKRTGKYFFLVGNTSNTSETFTLTMKKQKDTYKHLSGNISKYMYAVAHLGDLYDIWLDGGSQGNAVEFDDNDRTVTYDINTPLTLGNIVIPSNATYPVDIEFKLKDNIDVPVAIQDELIHVYQSHMVLPYGEEVPIEVIDGGITYGINIAEMADTSNKRGITSTIGITNTSKFVKVYPSPADDHVTFEYSFPASYKYLTLRITNSIGQIVNEIPMNNSSGIVKWNSQNSIAGMYTYTVYSHSHSIETGKIIISR